MQDYKPLFSLLIANYNNEFFFEETYQSIIQQQYDNWEVIILDDGSRKESIEKIKEIVGKDERFLFFENDKNYGVGITKSKLIEHANGQYVGFIDPDDSLASTAVSSAIETYLNDENVVLTYSRMMLCNEDLQPIEPYKSGMQVVNYDPTFFNLANSISHFVTFNKSIYETTEKMNPNLKIAEDQDLYLKMYEKGKVKFINDTNYYYRLHGAGISQNENKDSSHEYFAKVIYNAMMRRGLTTINGQKIPMQYPGKEAIFNLLEYQNSIPYRIKKKLKILLQS